MRPDRVRAIHFRVATVTPKTKWMFVEAETDAGLRGVGEATLGGHEQDVADAIRAHAPAVFAMMEAGPPDAPTPTSLAQAAAVSALDVALWDVVAQRRGTTLSAALGRVRRDRVPVYANINRRTRDRSPAGFAASARDAVAAGHKAIKVAPFDEATPGEATLHDLAPGIARLASVREAIGPERRLMVDCHWRLDEALARSVIDAAAELGVHWVECPVPERPATVAALARLRGAANRRGVLLAGLELGIGLAGFRPFLAAGSYDVMMPDVKYVGGLAEVMRVAEALQEAGVAVSPHNPTGPVCHAASLHACASIANVHSLEIQFDETPKFAALAGRDLQRVIDGAMDVPNGAGLGVTLQDDAGCDEKRWTLEASR